MTFEEFKTSVTIYVDSREQNCQQIINFFNDNGIKWKTKKLEYGDYSGEINNASFEKKIAIERKNSLSELAANFTRGRFAFANEFNRAYKDKCKMVLMVENGSWDDLFGHKYRSQISPGDFEMAIKTWQLKFMFDYVYVSKIHAGEYIVTKLWEFYQGA